MKLWTVYPGYVVTRSGDTIRGYVKLNNLVDNQEKALYYKNPEDKKYAKKYKPKDIKGYRTGPREYESFKFWPGGGAANAYHFFLKLVDGPIKYYRWYYEPEARTQKRFVVDDKGVKIDLSFDEKDLHYEEIAKKLNEKPVKIGLKYKSVMSKLVKEDKELANKILKKRKGLHHWQYL